MDSSGSLYIIYGRGNIWTIIYGRGSPMGGGGASGAFQVDYYHKNKVFTKFNSVEKRFRLDLIGFRPSPLTHHMGRLPSTLFT